MGVEVRCDKCGKIVPGAPPGQRITVCLTCQLLMDNPPEPQVSVMPARRSSHPVLWTLLALVILGGIGTGVWYLRRRHANEVLADRYPVAATDDQRAYMATFVARWESGREALLATMETFVPEPRQTGGRCPYELAPVSPPQPPKTDDELRDQIERSDPGDVIEPVIAFGKTLRDRVASQIDTLVETGSRARFHSFRDAYRVMRAIDLPLLVVTYDENIAPDPDHSIGGHRAGTAYAFDPATGKLACTGRFDAESSDRVQFASAKDRWGFQVDNLADAVQRDFDDNTLKAIFASLEAVR